MTPKIVDERLNSSEWLYEQYLNKGLSTTQIAELLGCCRATIRKRLVVHGIPRRTRGEAKKRDWESGTYTDRDNRLGIPELNDEGWLQEHYIEKKLSHAQIGKLLGCSASVVQMRLLEAGIPSRSLSDAGKVKWEQGIFGGRSTEEFRRKISLSVRERWRSGGFAGRSTEDYSCALSDALKKRWERGDFEGVFDNPELRQKRSEMSSGANNPCWRGGVSFEPYPSTFNDAFKKEIRERDNNTCVICWLPGGSVHHIDYDKEHTEASNCVVLCKSCHGKTNHNRNYWCVALSRLIKARRYRDCHEAINTG